ncbi:anthrone oxygenase family protein [Streptomyces sp. NPDC050287]|uniref:anthrone oxygenase family protein n=1 Tax=Streptomyces sp. NPDC050287 TaxID=3365608 RepID=UPI003793C1B2
MSQVIGVIALLGAGVTAGVLFCVAISLVPGFIALPPAAYVDAHRLFGRYFDRVMPPLVVTTTLLVAVLAFATDSVGRRTALIAAAVCLFGVSVVSQSRNVPINRRVKNLTAVPDDWDDPRIAWRNWHALRTAFAFLALVLTAAGVVSSN